MLCLDWSAAGNFFGGMWDLNVVRLVSLGEEIVFLVASGFLQQFELVMCFYLLIQLYNYRLCLNFTHWNSVTNLCTCIIISHKFLRRSQCQLILIIKYQLFHKTRIRLSPISFLPYKLYRLLKTPHILLHDIRTHNSSRSWDTSVTMYQDIMSLLARWVDKLSRLLEKLIDRKLQGVMNWKDPVTSDYVWYTGGWNFCL